MTSISILSIFVICLFSQTLSQIVIQDNHDHPVSAVDQTGKVDEEVHASEVLKTTSAPSDDQVTIETTTQGAVVVESTTVVDIEQQNRTRRLNKRWGVVIKQYCTTEDLDDTKMEAVGECLVWRKKWVTYILNRNLVCVHVC